MDSVMLFFFFFKSASTKNVSVSDWLCLLHLTASFRNNKVTLEYNVEGRRDRKVRLRRLFNLHYFFVLICIKFKALALTLRYRH